MKEQLKQPDAILEKLISARSEEVARIQKLQSEASKAIEIRGKAQLATLKKTLPKDWIAVLDSVDKIHDDASVATQARLKKVSSKPVAASSLPATAAPLRPGPAGSPPVATGTRGPFYPSYMVVYDNGVIVQEGAPFFLDQGPGAEGTGPGWYGVASQHENMVIDWWFQYSVPAATSYNHAIFVPFYGTYTVVADDGFWTSKAARVSLNLQAQGFQSNTGAIGTSNVLDSGNEQNVDLQNVPIPSSHSMSYYELLDAGEAYLRVSALYYVYARGSGSFALFNLVNADLILYVPSLYIE